MADNQGDCNIGMSAKLLGISWTQTTDAYI